MPAEEMEEGEYSNPLPPPPPPRGGGGGSNSNSSSRGGKDGLSNRDFRRIVMETPRRTADADDELPPPSAPPRSGEPKAASAAAKSKGDKDRKPKPRKGPRPSKGGDAAKPGEGEDANEGYRDRAKERRDGTNADYIGDEVFQKIHSAVQETARADGLQAHVLSAATESVGALQAFRNNLSVEESKFLGGDVQHTHLVKGLDYALAQKVKRELENKSRKTPASKAESPAPGALGARDGKVKFGSERARAIYKIIEMQANLIDHRSQMFRPGRAAYVYELAADDEGRSELPTTLIRSKADWVDDTEEIVVAADVLVLERLVKVVNQLRLHGGKDGKGVVHMSKKKKRRERELRSLDESLKQLAALKAPGVSLPGRKGSSQAAAGDNNADDDDDDIFEDAGNDYVPKASLPAGVNPEDVKAAETLPKKRIPRGDFEMGLSGEYDELLPGYVDAGSDEDDEEGGRKAARSKDQHRDGKIGGQMSKIRKILHDKHGESYEKAFVKK